MSRAVHFQLTINYESMFYYEEIRDYLWKDKKASYLISCIEENKHGIFHMHIYVQFKERTRLPVSKLHGAHVELCKGSSEDNVGYIEKIKNTYNVDNTWDEMGECRDILKKKGKIKLVKDLQNVNFDEVTISQYKVWKDVNADKIYTLKDLYKPDVEVTYIWGKSCVGKSKLVYETLGEGAIVDRVKFDGNFWDGVNTTHPTEICWYDDFRPSHMKPSEFINFIDYYKNPMNMKYVRGWKNEYKKIFITSIFSPHDIYQNISEESKEQWIRRMKIIHKEDPFNKNELETTK